MAANNISTENPPLLTAHRRRRNAVANIAVPRHLLQSAAAAGGVPEEAIEDEPTTAAAGASSLADWRRTRLAELHRGDDARGAAEEWREDVLELLEWLGVRVVGLLSFEARLVVGLGVD